ncbi:nose resistant to fluoxetine protein 6-like [Mercenaria mercenaria]|uniref:nose resistant to fluoxetine protein 6-like n=1 Tax=Mercenaria mercenaria TaxID=6596 RepID=UPI00234F65F6|nr:nose resistant to fluoxetine protein 6-like [Mercenaria mercenaria]
MLIARWIVIFAILGVAICQDADGTYLQTLLKGLATSNNVQQAGLSSEALFSLVGSVLQGNLEKIINGVVDTLTMTLDEAAKNYTSSLCLNHTELFIKALARRENWALRMVDSMGKPGTDLMDFSLNWAGNFDECVAIKAESYTDPVAKEGLEHPYTGKYCTATVQLTDATLSFAGPLGLNIGMCLPDTCSSADGSALMNIVTRLLRLNMTIPKMYMSCQEKSLEFTDKALAVTIVGSIFAAVIVVATTYDVIIQHYLRKGAKKDKTQKDDIKAVNGVVNAAYNHSISKDDLSNSDMKVHKNGGLPNGFTDLEKATNSEISPDKAPYKPGIPGKLLLSFSVYTNAPKILNTNQPKGTLTSVNGIRFLSMTWVILGHVYAFGLNLTDNLATFFPQIAKRFTFQAIMNASFSVDTFFVLSGLLVSYLSLREMKKRGGALKFNWLLFYFHRYWRLTPPYMLLLMLYVPTFKYWANGPFWPQTGVDVDECKDTWWTNLLYINNVYKADKQCMGWSWYLANDMQFYVISPFMLVPLYYSPIAGAVACLALILGNFISAGMISSHSHFHANILFDQDQTVGMKLYVKPWTRVGPYVVGFFTGYILYKTECKVQMSKVANFVGWSVATAIAVSVLYGLYTSDGSPPDFSNGVSALYNATSRTAWGLSVAWVIFACATGYGGPVNALLSWRSIIPLSRLTYCAYLVHPLVIYVYIFSRRTMMHWYDLEMIYLFLGHLCVSYAAAFVLSLAFESPMMGLERVLLGRKKNS